MQWIWLPRIMKWLSVMMKVKAHSINISQNYFKIF
jgi:hypothetical protein